MYENVEADDKAFRAEARREAPRRIKATDAQELKMTEARSALLWHQPFFAHLLLDRMEVVWSDEVGIAATDGRLLLLNPVEFGKFTVEERVFIMAHEVAHAMFEHCETSWRLRQRGVVSYPDGKVLTYHDQLMNWAMDYVINALLVEGKVGQFNKRWLLKPGYTGDMSVLDVYRKEYEDQQGGGGGKGEGFDEHLQPGQGSGQNAYDAAQGRDATAWKLAVQQAAAVARLHGKMPAGFDRMVSEIVDPGVDWREYIEGFFARTVGGGGYDWARGDRRFLARRDPVYVPSRSGNGCGPVVVAVDTSGSIGERELGLFFGCMAGILEDVRPSRIVVVWCDAKVQRVDEIEDGSDLFNLQSKGAPGGGGTDFRPVFNEVAKMGFDPDCLVYLTDMYGTFPEHAPKYPVLWAMITDEDAPWGAKLRLPDAAFG